MKQLRELESEEDDSGSLKGWADINSYSVWWALFSATLAQVEEDDSEKK